MSWFKKLFGSPSGRRAAGAPAEAPGAESPVEVPLAMLANAHLDPLYDAVIEADVSQLAEQIRAAVAGSIVVDPALAASALSSPPNPLTEREREVLAASSDGSNLTKPEPDGRQVYSGVSLPPGLRQRAEAGGGHDHRTDHHRPAHDGTEQVVDVARRGGEHEQADEHGESTSGDRHGASLRPRL